MIVPPRWASHRDVAVMHSCLTFVKQTRPAAGVYENVLGMEMVDNSLGDSTSALSMVCRELKAAGYVHLDASTWHKLVRQRLGTAHPPSTKTSRKSDVGTSNPFLWSNGQIPF